MKKGNTFVRSIFTITAIAAIAIIFFIPAFDSTKNNGISVPFNNGWYIEYKDGSRKPFDDFGKTIDSRELVLVHLYDDSLHKIESLGFYNYYSAVKVYLANELIYEYGSLDDINNKVELGNYYSIVNIHSHDLESKEIRVEFYSNQYQTIYGFDAGTNGALGRNAILSDAVALLTPIITIIFIVLSITIKTRKATRDLLSSTHDWLIIFAVFVSLWEIFDTQILMNLGMKAGTVCVLSFETYMILPFPLLMYTYNYCKNAHVINLVLVGVTFISSLFINCLYLLGVQTFLQSLSATHIIVIGSMLICLFEIINEYNSRKDRDSLLLLLGYISFVVTVAIQYLNFFVNPTKSNSTIIQIGVLIFLILQMSADFDMINQQLKALMNKLEKQESNFKSIFSSLVPDAQIDTDMHKNIDLINSGETRYLTVIESDIRGFTEITQNMSAQDAIEMLNNYLKTMTSIIRRHSGTVLEFVGDGIFAIFDERKAGKNHAEKAVVAAISMQYAMNEVNEWNKKHNYPLFEMGIGVHSGDAYVGYIGSQTRMAYGAIGETINRVSRIESYSTGGQILISKECKDNINIDLVINKSFTVLPKGYEKGIDVYLVSGLGEPYNINIDTVDITPIALTKPVEITIQKIVNKRTQKKKFNGLITELSETNATIETDCPIKLFDDLRIDYKGMLSCKVISKSSRGVLVRFTSSPSKKKK